VRKLVGVEDPAVASPRFFGHEINVALCVSLIDIGSWLEAKRLERLWPYCIDLGTFLKFPNREDGAGKSDEDGERSEKDADNDRYAPRGVRVGVWIRPLKGSRDGREVGSRCGRRVGWVGERNECSRRD